MRRDHRLPWLAVGALATCFTIHAGSAKAESTLLTATGNATAHLNFKIIIPKFLFLQVGTGTAFANNAAIDTITFDMTAGIASIGNATAQAGTGGDLTGGSVTARVVGNGFAGAATFSATAPAALSNGVAGQTIDWNQIAVAAPVALAGVVPAPTGTLPHPASGGFPFVDSTATTVSLSPTAGVINLGSKWTFSYLNATVPAAGTYGNTVANNGQVSYTIALP